MTAGVYLITCAANGRFYVGSSNNVERRFRRHITAMEGGRHHNPLMQRAWRKYGSSAFVLELIAECTDLGERTTRETAEIAARRATDPAIGFNIAEEAGVVVGPTGPKSAEHRRKIGDAHRGREKSSEERQRISDAQKRRLSDPEARARISAAKRGKALSAEACANIAAAARGRRHSAETRAKQAEAARRRWADPERGEELRKGFEEAKRRGVRRPMGECQKRAIGDASRGRMHSEATKARLSAIATERKPPEMTAERRQLIAEAQRKAWARRKAEA